MLPSMKATKRESPLKGTHSKHIISAAKAVMRGMPWRVAAAKYGCGQSSIKRAIDSLNTTQQTQQTQHHSTPSTPSTQTQHIAA